MSSARPARRAASAKEPPISPTPTTVTCLKCITSPLLLLRARLRDPRPPRSIEGGASTARTARGAATARRHITRSQDRCELRSTKRPRPLRPPLAQPAELCRAFQSRDLDQLPPEDERA